MKVQYPKTYCVFDFETTGLNPELDDILEIAVLPVKDGVAGVPFSCLINWNRPIPAKITEITGITEEMCAQDGIDPVKAFRGLFEHFAKQPIVGHNIINFDLPFLKNAVSKYLQMPLEQYEETISYLENNSIDTAAIFKGRKIDMGPGWNEPFAAWGKRVLNERVFGLKFNVGFCCQELGISREGIVQHRATGDVILTNEIYKKLCL